MQGIRYIKAFNSHMAVCPHFAARGEQASPRCALPRGDLPCGFLLLPELPNLPAVNSNALVTVGIFKRTMDSSGPSCPLSDPASPSSPFPAPFSKFKHFFLPLLLLSHISRVRLRATP